MGYKPKTTRDEVLRSNGPYIFYHGTLDVHVKSILEKGLLCRPPTRNWQRSIYYKGARGRSVFMCSTKTEWRVQSTFRITIPKKYINNLHQDGILGAYHFRFEGNIPPTWLRKIR